MPVLTQWYFQNHGGLEFNHHNRSNIKLRKTEWALSLLDTKGWLTLMEADWAMENVQYVVCGTFSLIIVYFSLMILVKVTSEKFAELNPQSVKYFPTLCNFTASGTAVFVKKKNTYNLSVISIGEPSFVDNTAPNAKKPQHSV